MLQSTLHGAASGPACGLGGVWCPSEPAHLSWGPTAVLPCHVSSLRLELFSRYVSQECKGDGESGFPAGQRGFGVDH